MNNKTITKEIGNVIKSVADAFDAELYSCSQAELEQYWHFRWDDSKSLAWNIYQFGDLLELYRRQVERWEEHHNGSCCVVERVRDQYLMPKIREFANQIQAKVSS